MTDESLTPYIFAPEWSDYVMTQFTEDELQDGYPKLVGLRRVAQGLRGPIRVSTTNIHVATPDFACVSVTLSIGKLDEETLIWSGCADASPANTEKGYGKYPAAIAESRAEARALRKILGLKVCSYEELSDSKQESLPDQPEKITGSQISLIDRMAKKMDIKVTLNKDSSYVEAQAFCKLLNNYQGKKESVPQEIRGYSEGWKV